MFFVLCAGAAHGFMMDAGGGISLSSEPDSFGLDGAFTYYLMPLTDGPDPYDLQPYMAMAPRTGITLGYTDYSDYDYSTIVVSAGGEFFGPPGPARGASLDPGITFTQSESSGSTSEATTWSMGMYYQWQALKVGISDLIWGYLDDNGDFVEDTNIADLAVKYAYPLGMPGVALFLEADIQMDPFFDSVYLRGTYHPMKAAGFGISMYLRESPYDDTFGFHGSMWYGSTRVGGSVSFTGDTTVIRVSAMSRY